ncbi:MAG: serine O-acetyltransferase [Clostridiales Family XIII bacterium]|jgi:serine O-acetyltransferase|nr:serine O-acetyltransferase [Clostridiales Family XIII bacterium]
MDREQDEKTIRKLVGDIVESYQREPDIIKIEETHRIDPEAVRLIIDDLRALIFAGYFDRRKLKSDSVEYYVGELMERLTYNLQKQIRHALCYGIDCNHCANSDHVEEDARQKTYDFLSTIPALRSLLATDVEAALEGDPAALSKDDVILSYPCIFAITVARLAHELYRLKVPLLPRMMTEHAHSITGIDINPGATIGHHFFMDHGTGIVVGETTVIGNYVKIYQGVTLGALSTRGGQVLSGVKRHPTIEDGVTIYAGASILGGNTVIGKDAVIGSNAFITTSVPAGTRVSIKNFELQFNQDENMGSVELEQGDFWFYTI